jgi:toxin YhaV
MLTVNGWQLYAHPLFLDQIERLIESVREERSKNPFGYQGTPSAKLLAALRMVVFERVPQDPADPRYRQGDSLGEDNKHWFRDKFGAGRFRVFFRYDSRAKIIIYAWVNDEESKRTYGAKTDAYAVFASMLKSGNPPNDWPQLLAAARAPDCQKRLSLVHTNPKHRK